MSIFQPFTTKIWTLSNTRVWLYINPTIKIEDVFLEQVHINDAKSLHSITIYRHEDLDDE